MAAEEKIKKVDTHKVRTIRRKIYVNGSVKMKLGKSFEQNQVDPLSKPSTKLAL